MEIDPIPPIDPEFNPWAADPEVPARPTSEAGGTGPAVNWLFIDMNSYFASVEQQDRPELRGRPVAVAPVDTDTTCAIAASYEAKRFGVKTGTNIGHARQLCPGLIVVPGNPKRYVE